MIGQTISHYKILEKLGEGGMGVVYKAHDTKLDRIVALKFLPQYLSSDTNEKERFYHEARAASALLHSNVAVIFEVNEHEGMLFLAMEYVEGQTLKKFIEENDPLSLKKVLDIAIQSCEGLVLAHEKGIVHRDIKADNIMITPKGQVKVMDFGLAKVKGATKLTKAGSTLGTAAYMSPEQAQGEEVDQRSDIFSFGVVLYELLTGKLPFRGEHQAALMYSLINEDPQPIARFNNSVPPDVERIAMKALAKDKTDRYQHVDDLLADLRRERKQLEYAKAGYTTTRSMAQAVPVTQPRKSYVKFMISGAVLTMIALAVIIMLMRRGSPETTGSNEPTRKMLAVLPFENLGSADQEYFADGLTEEVTSRLSGLSGFGVIARSSAMQYKKTTKPIKQIGEELGVSYILQGTIRWESLDGTTHLRVNPQLISVSDGTQMWSQPSEAVLASAFELQAEIAVQVANALNITLLQSEKQSLEAKLTENSEAYDAYLRGNEYAFRSSDERDQRIAEQMLQRAVELDPNFAEAYAKLSIVHADMYWEYYDRTKERQQKSKEAAEKAVQLNPGLPDAHGAMGFYYYHGLLDYENAIREFKLALQAQPNNVSFLLGISSVYRRQGKFEEAAENFMKACEIDPRSANLKDETGNTFIFMRKYAEAEQYLNRGISLSPDLADPYAEKAIMFLLQGNTTKAHEVVNDAARRKVGGDNPYIILNTLLAYSSDAQYKEALNYLEHIEAKVVSSQNFYLPREILYARLYGCLGESGKERANYDAAKIILERELQLHPDDTRIMSSLGLAYAGLGRKDDAVKIGQRAVELLPITREAMIGTNRLEDLALIYTMVGNADDAIHTLEQLLSIPSWMSAALVRIDPAWKPLRNNPRFQKLIAVTQ